MHRTPSASIGSATTLQRLLGHGGFRQLKQSCPQARTITSALSAIGPTAAAQPYDVSFRTAPAVPCRTQLVTVGSRCSHTLSSWLLPACVITCQWQPCDDTANCDGETNHDVPASSLCQTPCEIATSPLVTSNATNMPSPLAKHQIHVTQHILIPCGLEKLRDVPLRAYYHW